MEHIPRRLKLIAAAIAGTIAFGTAGYMAIEGYDFLDAIYMALITITTVGYAEIHPLSRNGRIFNSFVILIGVSVMFLAIGAMTQTVIELEFGEFFGKRRTKRMIEKLQNHFLICGFGRVGRGAAAEMARAGVPFLVVDRDEQKVERAMKAGMLAVLADSTRDETLRDVGIDRARGLVAALATDADNLFLILSAKTLNPGIHISARAAEEEAESKLRRAGADAVFAPYYLTGYRLAQAILRPHVHEFMDIFTRDIGLNVAMEQVRVDGASEFASRSLKDMQLRREIGVIVLAIRRADGAMQFNPPADAIISGGDHLIVMGANDNLRRLEQLLMGSSTGL
jgi:voltage-gated potassium channel